MFTFVDLSPDEIIQGLNAAGIEVKKANLETPKAPAITQIYKQYLMVLASFEDETHLEHPHLAPTIEAPDELRNGFVFLNFFRQLMMLTKSAAIPDFSLSDLVKPEKQRVQHHLSGLINFGIFREDRLVMFQGLQERVQQRIRETEEMHEQLMQLREGEEDYAKRRSEIDSLENKKRSQLVQLSEVEEAIVVVQESLEKRKRDELEILADIRQAEDESQFTTRARDDFEAEAKSSRPAAIAELKAAQAALEAEKRATTAAPLSLEEMRQRRRFLSRVRESVLAVNSMAEVIMRERKKSCSLEADRKGLEEAKVALEAARAAVEQLKQEKTAKSTEKQNHADQIKQMKESLRKQKQVLKSLQDQHAREMLELSDRVDALKGQIHSFMADLTTAINK
jgi:hypothetical protein